MSEVLLCDGCQQIISWKSEDDVLHLESLKAPRGSEYRNKDFHNWGCLILWIEEEKKKYKQ